MKKTTYLLRKSVHPDQKYHSSKYIMAFGCIPEAACSLVPGSAAIVTGTSDSGVFVEGVCPCAESLLDLASATAIPSALEHFFVIRT